MSNICSAEIIILFPLTLTMEVWSFWIVCQDFGQISTGILNHHSLLGERKKTATFEVFFLSAQFSPQPRLSTLTSIAQELQWHLYFPVKCMRMGALSNFPKLHKNRLCQESECILHAWESLRLAYMGFLLTRWTCYHISSIKVVEVLCISPLGGEDGNRRRVHSILFYF